MKSRIAMLAMLVFGLLLSGTGAGLAVSGISSSNNASVAQYGTTETQGTAPAQECDLNGDGVVSEDEDLNGDAPGCDESGVLGEQCDANGDGVISPSEAAVSGCSDVKGNETVNNPTNPARGAQPTRQVESGSDDSLPFTGFAAIPILVAGIALLGAGLVLRRRVA